MSQLSPVGEVVECQYFTDIPYPFPQAKYHRGWVVIIYGMSALPGGHRTVLLRRKQCDKVVGDFHVGFTKRSFGKRSPSYPFA